MLDVIKSYLVSLGYHVDVPSFQNAKGTMGEMEKVVSKFSDSSVLKFAAAGAAGTGFVSAAVAALQYFTVGVANADLQNEMFARRMWMSKDAAVSYKNSLDALGVSLQDLYLSPELMNKFTQLRQQASTMAPPGGFSEAMKGIRSITFEWQRFKLEASYAVYWVGYYLTKYLSGPMFGLKGGLKEINDSITANMPKWTKNVAQFLSWLTRLGNSAYLAGKSIRDIWNSLGDSTKKVAGITAGFFALLKMGPVGWIIAGLTTLLLLLDDFYTYEQGGKSALPKLWEWVDQFKKSLQDDGTISDFKENLEDLSGNLLDVATNIGKILDYFAELVGYDSVLKMFLTGLNTLLENTSSFLATIAGSLKDIHGYLTDNPEESKQGVQQRNKGFSKLFGEGGAFQFSPFGAHPFGAEDPNNLSSLSKGTDSYPGGLPMIGERGTKPVNIQVMLNSELVNREIPQAGTSLFDNFKQWLSVTSDGFKQLLAIAENQVRPGNPVSFGNPSIFSYGVRTPKNANISYEIKPTYHIYGANQPENVAVAVNRSNAGLLMRAQQGVIV